MSQAKAASSVAERSALRYEMERLKTKSLRKRKGGRGTRWLSHRWRVAVPPARRYSRSRAAIRRALARLFDPHRPVHLSGVAGPLSDSGEPLDDGRRAPCALEANVVAGLG